MLPTYCFPEVKHLIRSLDVSDLTILADLVHDEINRYPSYESRAIFKMISVKQKVIAGNEVMFEYLLAYN